MLHVYWGDGKGKTTAAMGLALRALGRGRKVCIAQFLKNGTSGELEILRAHGAVVCNGMTSNKFSWQMTDEEKAALRDAQTALVHQLLRQPWDLLVLDEACDAWDLELVDHTALKALIEAFAADREIVLTGRKPSPWLQERADYSTQMVCHAHPFQKGLPAREGIEY